MNVVAVEGFGFAYGRHRVFDSVDLRISPGVTGLLGPNGAGKTTLLSVLATLAPVRVGRINVLGLDVADRGQRRQLRARIGFVPQRFGVVGSFTVLESVSYAAWLHGVPSPRCVTAARKVIEQVDLTSQADRKVRKLSGGMRQRLGIAQALAHEPELLLLDEPTVGLDPGQRLRLRELLRQIGQARSVVVSTHMVDDVEQACGRVVVLDRRVVFNGTPAALAERGAAGHAPGTALERGYTSLVDDVPAGRST